MKSFADEASLALGIALGVLCACSAASGASKSVRRGDLTSKDPPSAGPGDSILASAPPGMSLRDLGRPFTVGFSRFQGTDGQTLFPNAGAEHRTPQHAFEHEVHVIDHEEELAANAGAWGIESDVSSRRSMRYAGLRVLEIDHVYEVDDTTAMKQAPPGAVYYPWRLYMGRRYEVILEGSEEHFHAGVRASLLEFSGEIEDFAENYGLKHTVQARGLAPADDRAIFSRNQADIKAHYRSTINEPVPVLVEWRRIPGRQVLARPVAWAEQPKGCPGQPGCEPCGRWSFHRVEARVSPRTPDGRVWDADESAPDVILSLSAMGDNRTSTKRSGYSRLWTLDPPMLVAPGTIVRLRAIDQDLVSDDPIFLVEALLGPTLLDGKLNLGAGSAAVFGECVDVASSRSATTLRPFVRGGRRRR